MNTKAIGERTEAVVLAALLQVYPTVLIPFGDNQRYDFVFEDFDGTFKKVQSKTARYKNGTLVFATSSSTMHRTNGTFQNYKEDVDFFGVHYPGFADVYLVPITKAMGGRQCSLRIDEPKSYRSSINWAKDYLLYSPCK